MDHRPAPFWRPFQESHRAIHCSPKGPIAIDLQNITVAYSQNTVLSGLSCHMQAPSLWGIAGPNGAGKSTLLKTLLGLQKPTKGKIIFHGFCPCDVEYLSQQNQLD